MPNTVWKESLSKSILDLVEDKASIGSWSWDMTSGVLEWSIGVYRILGLPPSHMPGMDALREQVDAVDAPLFQTDNPLVLAKVLADRRFSIRRPDGEVRLLHSHGKVVAGRNGQMSLFVGAFLDITESRLEDELFLLREAILDSMRGLFGVSIWQTDASGEAVNLMQWSGSPVQVEGGAPWVHVDSIHVDDRDGVIEAWQQAQVAKTQFSVTFRSHRDNEKARFEAHAVPILDGNNLVRGWLGHTRKSEAFESSSANMISAAQIRAARALLGWTGRELADRAHVSFSTIRRLETSGSAALSQSSLDAVYACLHRAGVRFLVDDSGRAGVSGS